MLLLWLLDYLYYTVKSFHVKFYLKYYILNFEIDKEESFLQCA